MAAVELRLLRALTVVAEEGHVGRAARRLHLSQPALTKQIATLERITGVQLFLRHSAGVTPTAAAELLLTRARRVLSASDDFAFAVEHAKRSLHGRLTVGFVGSALNEHTSDILSAFRRQCPEVVVDFRQYDMTDLTGGLDDGSSDVAFLRLPVGVNRLRHQPVVSEPRVAVLPADHRLAQSDSLSVTELFNEPWVISASSDPAYQRYALALAARDGRAPIVGPTVRSVDEYLEAVRAGQGIGLAPASAQRYYSRPGVTFVVVSDAEPSVAAVSFDPRRPPQPPARALLTLIRSRVPALAK
jgi:DNA-binding transcriptional LysR family regulator